jgi:hypothetical protein
MNKPTKIELPPLQLAHAEIGIMGDTPLIVHAWSQKAKGEMLLKQMKQPVHREAKDPVEAFLRSMYRTDSEHYGIPAVGVKNAMVTACTSVEGITKTAARQAFIIVGERGKTKAAFADLFSPQDLVRVLSPNPPALREDMVRLSGIGNAADLRYRPEFWPWGAKLIIKYNANVLSLDQLLNLLNTSGFGVGLCEWRPERNGQSGTFHVADEADMRELESRPWQMHQEPALPDVSRWLRQEAVAAASERNAPTAPKKRTGGRKRAVAEAAHDPVLDTPTVAANDPGFEPEAEVRWSLPVRRRRRRFGPAERGT